MKTSEKILDVGRRLLNEKGIAGLSLRDISGELQISLGNLTYHYPNKEALMMALYRAYQSEVAEAVEDLAKREASVLVYLETHRAVFKVQERYKFLFLSLFEVFTQFPAIKEDYVAWAMRQRKYGEMQLREYQAKGIFSDSMTEPAARRILDVGQILHTQWLVESEFVFFADEKVRERHYLSVCCGLLEPYLAPDPLAQYQAFFEAL